jgi:hypothetical protein
MVMKKWLKSSGINNLGRGIYQDSTMRFVNNLLER